MLKNITTNPYKIKEDFEIKMNKITNNIKDEKFLEAKKEIYQLIIYLQGLKVLTQLKHEDSKNLINNEDIEYIKMLEEKIIKTRII